MNEERYIQQLRTLRAQYAHWRTTYEQAYARCQRAHNAQDNRGAGYWRAVYQDAKRRAAIAAEELADFRRLHTA